MSSVKNYASLMEKGYASALNRIQKRFDLEKGYLDEQYLARARQINKETHDAKNSASAGHTIGLANVRDELLSKGLSSSGESVNAVIRSNLAKNSDYAKLDAEATRSHTENALSRSRELGNLISNRIDAEAELEDKMLKAVRDEERYADEMRMKEEASAEDKRRWETEQAMKEASAKDERERWEAEQASKEASAKEERERWEKETERRNFESDRKFAADEAQRKIENSQQAQKIAISMEKTSSGTSDGEKGSSVATGGTQTPSGYVPDYSADELVRDIFKSIQRQYFPSEKARSAAMEKSIYQILNDTTLAPSFKAEVRVYASALGYI